MENKKNPSDYFVLGRGLNHHVVKLKFTQHLLWEVGWFGGCGEEGPINLESSTQLFSFITIFKNEI